MDLATLIGFVAGAVIFIGSLIAGAGDSIGGFLDYPSVIMVLGGGISMTLLSVRLDRFLGFLSIVKNALFTHRKSPLQMIQELVRLAEVSRREGVLALEKYLEEIDDRFVATALRMVVDGMDPDTVKQSMEAEMAAIDFRHGESKQVVDLLGKYAPAFGMIGTLVGLVIMLSNMDDPKKIGPGMAVAILTTLYGAIMGNMVCLPLADKLSNRHAQEMLNLTIAQAAVLGIQAGDNPRILQSKLTVYLSPRLRAKLESEKSS